MARGTERMKEVIRGYLEREAAKDAAFAQSYAREDKSLDECIDYIITTVKATGREGFDDSEIYGMAVHYYQEDDPGKITRGIGGQVVINHAVELSPEEIEEAKRKAQDRITEQEVRRIKDAEKKAAEKAKEKRKQEESEGLVSLFGEEE